jgi:ABC-type glycerol-3-phosphate transport system substrate-binding protein
MAEYWKELQNRLSSGEYGVVLRDLSEVDERSILPRIQAADAAQSGATLVTYFSGWNTFIFLNQGLLEPFDDYVDAAVIDSWMLNESIDGKHYLAPFLADAAVLFANRRLAEDAGIELPPRYDSWDTFVSDLRKVKDTGIVPVALGAQDGLAQDKWTQAVEMEHLDSRAQLTRVATGQTAIDDSIASGWMERLEQLRVDGLIPEGTDAVTEQQSISAFLEGEHAYIMTFPGSIISAENADDYQIVGYWKGDGQLSAPLASVGSGLQMRVYGDNKEAAGALVEFMHQPEQITLFNELTGELPANRNFDAANLGALQRELFTLQSEGMPGEPGTVWPHDAISGTHLTTIWDAAREILAGEGPSQVRTRLAQRVQEYQDQNPSEIEALTKYADAIADADSDG